MPRLEKATALSDALAPVTYRQATIIPYYSPQRHDGRQYILRAPAAATQKHRRRCMLQIFIELIDAAVDIAFFTGHTPF